jgi:transposase
VPFQAVVEATASYEWLWLLLEPLADCLVLANPKKLRIIAESTRKSDRLDAQVLAEFLALDMIPAAYRPTPRQRQHRALVRQRMHLRRCTTRAKNKIRRLLSDYNADRRDLFSAEGLELGITKEGSRSLRGALVEAAWRIVRLSRRWEKIFAGLQRRGKKKAIVAVARRLLTVMAALMRSGERYHPAGKPPVGVAATA